MSDCHHDHSHSHSSTYQTLDELDFERGIWFAAQHNDLDRVKKLLGQGVDVNIQDKSGYTALHYASRNGHFDICKLLLAHKAEVNVLTRAGKASPLHRCAAAGHVNIFNLLLTSGADINLQDDDGKTVLHRAVESRNKGLCEIILKVKPELAKVADKRGNVPRSNSIVNIQQL